MKNVRAGKLRKRITVMAPPDTETFYETGQPVSTFTAIGTYWGEIVPVGGKELVVANGVKYAGTHKVYLRYQGSVAIGSQHQLTYNGRTLSITSTNNIEERNRLLELICNEVTG